MTITCISGYIPEILVRQTRLTLSLSNPPPHSHSLPQTKSVFDIAIELNRLHELGLQGKLPPSDIVGGTFSLSNIGAVS